MLIKINTIKGDDVFGIICRERDAALLPWEQKGFYPTLQLIPSPLYAYPKCWFWPVSFKRITNVA